MKNNLLLKFANTKIGREYFGVPEGKEVVKIDSSIHYFTGEFTKDKKPIFCCQGSPGGYKLHKQLKILDIFPDFVSMAFLGLRYGIPLIFNGDTGLCSPSGTGAKYNELTNPTYAYTDDTNYATTGAVAPDDGKTQSYESFGFTIPGGATLTQIDVVIKWYCDRGDVGNGYPTLRVYLWEASQSAWCNSYAKFTNRTSEGEETKSAAGGDPLWDPPAPWALADFSNANFTMRVNPSTIGVPSGNTSFYINHIQVKVYYTSTVDYHMDATVGTFALTGVNTNMTKTLNMSVSKGQYVLTGVNVIFTRGYGFAATVGEYTLTGINVAMTKALKMAVSAGSYALTGVNVAMTKAIKLITQVGQYVLTGFDVALVGLGSWKYTNLDKHSASMTNLDRHSASMTNKDKNSMSATNLNKTEW